MQSIRPSLSKEEMSQALSIALCKDGLINQDDTAILFYDLSFLSDRVTDLINLFPADTLHAVAVKANPLTGILLLLKDKEVGLEVASLPELYLAEKLGFPHGRIVFDSPSKTKAEIEYALKLGAYINADSFDELDRIADALKTIKSKSRIGVRVNPQVGAGSIRATSVAGEVSKFGIPMDDNIARLEAYYLKYEWLKGIHVHIGSQGCPVPLIVEGIKKVLNFAKGVNERHGKKIDVFDLGGGLAVSYHQGEAPVSMKEYREALRENFPALFSGEFKLITEFGRYIHANAGWAASKVEYVKREKDHNIIMTHIGADLLLRKCYNPGDWHHNITVADKNGRLKTGSDKNKYMVAGPLCFAGDIIAANLELPVVEEGDYILVHDIGAYTLSMWSRYNSRQIPKVIGYASDDSYEIIKERETLNDLFEFWS